MKARFASCWIGPSLLPVANACFRSFLVHGHEFVLYTHQPVRDVPAGVEGRDAEPILSKTEIVVAHGGLETAADLFTYRFLDRVGGWVVDADVLCNAAAVPDVEIAFAEERIGIINNALLKFPKGHPAIDELLDYVESVDSANSPWGSTGPLALSKILGRRPDLAPYKLPTADVYPFHWREAPKILFPEFKEEVVERTKSVPFIHLWGAALREIGFDFDCFQPFEGSYLEEVYERYLEPHIWRRLSPPPERQFRRSVQEYAEQNWDISLPLG